MGLVPKYGLAIVAECLIRPRFQLECREISVVEFSKGDGYLVCYIQLEVFAVWEADGQRDFYSLSIAKAQAPQRLRQHCNLQT